MQHLEAERSERESAPCGREQISEVGPEGSREQTSTEQCTCAAALCKLHMPMTSPAPTPAPCERDGMDAASTPFLLPCKCVFLHSPTPISFFIPPRPVLYSFSPSLIFPLPLAVPHPYLCVNSLLILVLDCPHAHAFHFHVTAPFFRSLLLCQPALAVGQRLLSLSLSLSLDLRVEFSISPPLLLLSAFTPSSLLL